MSTNYISQITATDGVTYDVQEGVTTRIFRATCTTSASTAEKVATLDDDTGYSLTAGVRIAVTFKYGNTATYPTLNVNSGGAKYIYYKTAASSAQNVNELCVWGANETVIFTYDGSSWTMMGSSLALYNAYNKAASSGSGTITEVKTNAGAHTTIDVLSGKAEFNVPTKTSHLTNDSGFITSYTDTKNTAGSTNSASKLYLIGATEQSANPQTYSNSNLYYDSINGFYVKSPTHSNSYSCIKQDNYGCTNIYAYSSSDDMPLSTILASSSEVFLGNRSLEMGYNSSISIIDGDIYLSTGANDKHVYIYNLGAPSNDTDAANKKYVDDSIGALTIPTKTSDLTNDSGFITSYTDTKNTAGSTNSTSKLYLIGAEEQSTNPQTYSSVNLTVTDGAITANGDLTLDKHNNNQSKLILKYDDSVYTTIYTSGASGNISALLFGNPTTSSASTGNVSLRGIARPSTDYDAANKKYVDDSISAIDLTDYVDWASLNSEVVPTTFTNNTISFDWNDTSYNSASQNVQWALETIINEIDNIGDAKVDSNTLASVATSGSYNDLLNANWLNGSATGSVRTSGSGPEGSSYTIGQYATTEGYDTFAHGIGSHAEGAMTVARGSSAHSEGTYTSADGSNSHASGYWTGAQRASQTVIGEYNILDTAGTTTTRGDYVFIIGNGTSSARSNALTVDWNGNVNIPSGASYKVNGVAIGGSKVKITRW